MRKFKTPGFLLPAIVEPTKAKANGYSFSTPMMSSSLARLRLSLQPLANQPVGSPTVMFYNEEELPLIADSMAIPTPPEKPPYLPSGTFGDQQLSLLVPPSFSDRSTMKLGDLFQATNQWKIGIIG